MKTVLTVIALCGLLLAPGCGDGSSSGPAGTWEADVAAFIANAKAAVKKKTEGQPGADAMLQMMDPTLNQMASSMKMTIGLESDGKCWMESVNNGKSEKAKGTWKQEGDRIVITAEGEDAADAPAFVFRDGRLQAEAPIPEVGTILMPFNRK